MRPPDHPADRTATGGPLRLDRRRFLASGLAVGTAAGLSSAAGRLLEQAAAAAAPAGATLGDIEHVVVLMQENRSFDHYFGTLSGVRGFADPDVPSRKVGPGRRVPVFAQSGYQPGFGPAAEGLLEPFELVSDPPGRDGQTTNDITHDWGPQHLSWNGGRMDSFVTTHLAADGDQNGTLTMGYYARSDLPFYYALADAFTVCDAYHCSVLGPTDPNRVMLMSASIDPAGTGGGPVLETLVANRAAQYGKLTWESMPERLSQAGVSWKLYQDPSALIGLSPMPYFRPFGAPSTPAEVAMAAQALTPAYPADFTADVAAGTLPAVSWIVPNLAQCEHPAAPPEYGENLVQTILATLVSNPDVWATTALFVVYDENGGFFDHVPPPVPPPGTAGEYLTVDPLPAAAAGIEGPVGLGFRTPCLVVSPFSAGGNVCSEVFDHTSVLRFIETRFGVPVPNLTPWRRSVTGDLTGAFSFGSPPVTAVPPLPATSLGDLAVAEQAVRASLLGTEDAGPAYPVPPVNQMPTQETTPVRRRVGTAPSSGGPSPGGGGGHPHGH